MTLGYRIVAGALAVVLALTTAAWVYREGRVLTVTVAAGPASEEAYQLALAIADVAEQHAPGLAFTVLETAGTKQNNELLGAGSVDFALSQANLPAPASARLVAPLYPDAFHVVVRRGTGIERVADLRGRKIAIPPTGSGQFEAFWFLMEHYGLNAAAVDALPMSSEAGNWAMFSNAVDAVFRLRAPGNASVRELVSSTPSELVPIVQAGAMRLRAPSLEAGSIPRGAYGGTPPLPEADLPTATVPRLLLVHADVEATVANAVTRVLFERRRELVAQTPLAGFVSAPERSAGTLIPIHEGAARYYDRDEPSFFQENAEPIALALSVLVLLGSGVLRLVSQRRRRRVDRYNNQVLMLYAEARRASEPAELALQRDRLMNILGQVVDDAEEGRVTDEGFHVFSVTWRAVSDALHERSAELGSGVVGASDD